MQIKAQCLYLLQLIPEVTANEAPEEEDVPPESHPCEDCRKDVIVDQGWICRELECVVKLPASKVGVKLVSRSLGRPYAVLNRNRTAP